MAITLRTNARKDGSIFVPDFATRNQREGYDTNQNFSEKLQDTGMNCKVYASSLQAYKASTFVDLSDGKSRNYE